MAETTAQINRLPARHPLVVILVLFFALSTFLTFFGGLGDFNVESSPSSTILDESTTCVDNKDDTQEILALLDSYLNQQKMIKDKVENEYKVLIDQVKLNLTILVEEVESTKEAHDNSIKSVMMKMDDMSEIHSSLKDSIASLRNDVEKPDNKDENMGSVELEMLETLITKVSDLEKVLDKYEAVVEKEKEIAVSIPTTEEIQSMITETCIDEAASLYESVVSKSKATTHGYASNKNIVKRPDFAQRGAGGSVVSRLTSPTYNPKNIPMRRFAHALGFSTGYGFPEDALSIGVSLGHCWPMEGSNGNFAVQLNSPVLVDAISIDHVSKEEAITLKTAIKDFEIYGYKKDDTESNGELLYSGRFEIDGNTAEPVQTFTFDKPFTTDVIRLHILNNHGSEEFTCLYRLRVHGQKNEQ